MQEKWPSPAGADGSSAEPVKESIKPDVADVWCWFSMSSEPVWWHCSTRASKRAHTKKDCKTFIGRVKKSRRVAKTNLNISLDQLFHPFVDAIWSQTSGPQCTMKNHESFERPEVFLQNLIPASTPASIPALISARISIIYFALVPSLPAKPLKHIKYL